MNSSIGVASTTRYRQRPFDEDDEECEGDGDDDYSEDGADDEEHEHGERCMMSMKSNTVGDKIKKQYWLVT